MQSGLALKSRWLVLLCSASVTVAGCATGGEHAAGDEPARDGREASHAAAPIEDSRPAHRKLGYRLEWRGTPVTAKRSKIESVRVYDEIVTVIDSTNTLSVLETDTGVNRWTSEAGKPLDRVHGTVMLDDGRVLVSSDIDLRLFDPKSGTLTDRQDYANLTSTAPVVVGRYVCVGCENGQLLIHNLSSGFRQHSYDFGETISVAPVAVGSRVGAVARNGRVFMIDPHSGKSVGRTRVYAGISTPPATSDDAMFVASLDQSLWAFEFEGGGTRWRIRTQGKLKHPVTHHDGVVYTVIPKRGLSAIDAHTGEVLWENAGVEADVVCTRGDRLIAFDGTHAYAIQTVSGDVMDRLELPGVDRVLTDNFDDGNLYTVSVSGAEIRKHSPVR